jgi:hypothetical protein
VIVSLHVASGAAVGALAGSRGRAAALAPVAHLAGDLTPHWDLASRRFEMVSGAALLLAVAARHGPLSPAAIGALLASAPDVEHVVRLPRPGGRKLFPTHRVAGWHRSGGLPTWTQLLAAGLLAGMVLGAPRRAGFLG